MPLYGHELDRDTTPIEAGLGGFLRHKEADYVGRAALAAAPVRKRLVGLQGTGRRAARSGYTVLRDGQPVGRITSGALSPTLGFPIALAFIDGPEPPPPGTEIGVDLRGQVASYTITTLPFYVKEPR
jgi:aminomethyltransferase